MQIYEITPGNVYKYERPDDNKLRLGEEGRGRKLTIVPIIGDGDNYHVAAKDDNIYIVADNRTLPHEEGRCIAIIDTIGGYSRYRDYGIFDITSDGQNRVSVTRDKLWLVEPGENLLHLTPPNLKLLTFGRRAFGEAGRINSGYEYLAIVKAPLTFRLKGKYSSTWFTWTGEEWLVESPAEYSARMAIDEYNKGGKIEWL